MDFKRKEKQLTNQTELSLDSIRIGVIILSGGIYISSQISSTARPASFTIPPLVNALMGFLRRMVGNLVPSDMTMCFLAGFRCGGDRLCLHPQSFFAFQLLTFHSKCQLFTLEIYVLGSSKTCDIFNLKLQIVLQHALKPLL